MAAWEDGIECWFCNHYHWDEYCCGLCGACDKLADDCPKCFSLLCETCCELRLEAEGCDCDDRCISDSDIESHIENEHKNAGPHSATPQNTFDMDETYHWRPCRFCGESSHITNKTKHTFDNYGICTVCRFLPTPTRLQARLPLPMR